MAWIYLLKFIHVILAISLLGTAFYCLAAAGFKKSKPHLNKVLLILALFALLSGTMLVLPKHYTFTTPWIQAAFVLVLGFGLLVSGMIFLKKRNRLQHWGSWVAIYSLLVILLVIVIHDAVTKTTFVI